MMNPMKTWGWGGHMLPLHFYFFLQKFSTCRGVESNPGSKEAFDFVWIASHPQRQSCSLSFTLTKKYT